MSCIISRTTVMKRHNLMVVMMSACAVVALAWLFHTPAPAAMPQQTGAPKPVAVNITAPKLASGQIAPPVMPASKPGEIAADTAVAAPAADADPQAELSTSLDDIINLLQSGDLYTAMMRYVPPDKLAQIPDAEKAGMQAEIQSQMSQPQAQMGIQMMVQVLQSMKTMTPAMSETGDKATYQISDPTGQDTRTQPMAFQKIDGKWYVDPDSMGGM
jgi:hypothetical protein